MNYKKNSHNFAYTYTYIHSGVARGGPAGARPRLALLRPRLAAAEVQVVVAWTGLRLFSISALRAPLKYFGPVSRAEPAQGGVRLYYCLMNTATVLPYYCSTIA